MTVAEIIGEAREEHPAFNPAWTPDPLVRRFLTRYQQTLLSLIAREEKDAIDRVQEVWLPLAFFADGEQLEEDVLLVHGGTVVLTNGEEEEFEPAGYKERLEPFDGRYRGYVADGVLHLLGDVEDWKDVRRIDLHYFPKGGELATNAATFILPGQVRAVLVAAAADYLARRAPDEAKPPVDRRRFATALDDLQGIYLDEVTQRNRPDISVVREVW